MCMFNTVGTKRVYRVKVFHCPHNVEEILRRENYKVQDGV